MSWYDELQDKLAEIKSVEYLVGWLVISLIGFIAKRNREKEKLDGAYNG